MMILNTYVLIWLHGLTHQSALLDSVIIFIATKLDKIVIVVIVALLLREGFLRQFHSHRLVCVQCYEHLIVTIIIVCSARAIAEVIKILTHLPRPFIAITDMQPLFTFGAFDSFPSGHATLFFALAVGVYRHRRSWGIILFVLAFFISISRVIAGVHYPLDIFTGMLIGLVIGGIALIFDQK